MNGLVGCAIAPSFQLRRQSYRCGVVLLFLKLGVGFLCGFSGFPFFKTKNVSMPVQFFLRFRSLSSNQKTQDRKLVFQTWNGLPLFLTAFFYLFRT